MGRPAGRARRVVIAAVTVCAVVSVLIASRAGATPHRPQPPTIASVAATLDKLAKRAETLSEKYNATLIAVRNEQHAAFRAQRTAASAARHYAAARLPVIRIAVARYQGADPSSVGAFLSSEDKQAYLDSLATSDMIATRFANLAAEIDGSRKAAEAAGNQARAALARAQAARNALTAQRVSVQEQTDRFNALLNSLTAPQQQVYFNRNAPTPAEIATARHLRAPSRAAQIAVDFAWNQLGKPYVWAAAGPDAFDCSGLTMAAYHQAGIYLPHLSQAQFLLGRQVAFNQMKPGDLIFLYPDVHHVELYIGNGLAISAPQEGEPVKIVRVENDADFHGAKRFG